MRYSTYLHEVFVQQLPVNARSEWKYIVEVGARDGLDAIQLAKYIENADVYTFECNPLTLPICEQNIQNERNDRIHLLPYGLGEKEFFPYVLENPGASSFLKRIDFNISQTRISRVKLKRLEDEAIALRIPYIDLLCMDVQGYEINVLKGGGKFLTHIKWIIMEEPNPVINKQYLPEEQYSKYMNAPTPSQIQEFMTRNHFIEIARVSENFIEDNVMYRNISNE